MRQFVLLLVLSMPFLLNACVTSGKYDEMVALRNESRYNFDSLAVRTTFMLTDLRRQNDSLRQTLRKLTETYNRTRSMNSEEITRLLDSLQQSQSTLSAREQRLHDLEARLASRDSALNAITARLNDALLSFKETGLSITIKNGKVYVSLSNQLLFGSGKTDIDKHGKAALDELANVLAGQPDLGIVVEGHTDNAKVIDLGSIRDNWDLSVLRSTEVVRFLTKGDRLDAHRVTASGRSEYDPLEVGTTKEARAKNRRTEIILTPKLGELFELLGK